MSLKGDVGGMWEGFKYWWWKVRLAMLSTCTDCTSMLLGASGRTDTEVHTAGISTIGGSSGITPHRTWF